MNLEPSDRMQTIVERPYAGTREHARAYAYLRRRHAEGTLLPVHEGTEDIVADYVSILGIKTGGAR